MNNDHAKGLATQFVKRCIQFSGLDREEAAQRFGRTKGSLNQAISSNGVSARDLVLAADLVGYNLLSSLEEHLYKCIKSDGATDT